MSFVHTHFREGVVSLGGYLKPFALHLTHNDEEANELLQETMYRALANEDKFKVETNLKAWLYTIMKNVFINSYRKTHKRNTLLYKTTNQYYLNSSMNNLSVRHNAAENKFLNNDINAALNSISRELQVPSLMHFQGYTYPEIADHLDLPLGTVKSRIFFARKVLQAKLRIYRAGR